MLAKMLEAGLVDRVECSFILTIAMPNRVVRRAATELERVYLEDILRNAATTGHRWKQGAENALVLCAASLLGLVIVWLGAAWLARKLFAVDFGLHSGAAVWVLGAATPLCATYSVISSTRWVRGWKDYRPLLKADIGVGEVSEEHYVFVSAKRFQEPEHGGLMYLLRTTEDKVLALFDHESRALGAQDGDPMTSTFLPRSTLTMVRAPTTGFVISRSFSGAPLEVGDTVELAIEPERWPESDNYVNIPWSDLETRLGPETTMA